MSYTEDMKKTNKTRQIGVRVEETTIEELEKEAQKKGLDLSTYVRNLVFTHQDRQKKKS